VVSVVEALLVIIHCTISYNSDEISRLPRLVIEIPILGCLEFFWDI